MDERFDERVCVCVGGGGGGGGGDKEGFYRAAAKNQYHNNSLPFHFTSIRPTIPEIHLFEIWPWNIQGQGHDWGQRPRSHFIPSILLMHFLFVSHQSDQPFLRYGQNRVWPWNRANLKDLIAATGLVILFKLDSNRRFFRPCDLEIWWMIPKNNRAPLLYYIKLCASFQIHQSIQTGVTIRKQFVSKLMIFCPMLPCNLTDDLEKQ